MTAQDDARENRLVDLFNLERPENRVRHGTDAILSIDDHVLEFELKSVTTKKGGLTTVRDFGPEHIRKWRDKHWLVSFYDGDKLTECKYGSPAAMASWIEAKWDYVKDDFAMALIVPDCIDIGSMISVIGQKEIYSIEDAKRLHKKQYTAGKYRDLMDKPNGYSPERMLQIFRDRARYVIERGSTLNNPHISLDHLKDWPIITKDHASSLRELVKKWLASNAPKAHLQPPLQPDTP